MTNSMNLELLIGKRIACNPEGGCRSPYALSTPAALKNVYVTDVDSSYTISDYLKIMSLGKKKIFICCKKTQKSPHRISPTGAFCKFSR